MKFIAMVSVLLVSVGATVARAQAPRNHGGFLNVVVIFQENRTPDNLFGSNPHFTYGVDIASSGVNSQGQVIPLAPVPLANDYDLSHAHSAFVKMYDNGKMDGANKIAVTCSPGSSGCPPANPQFRYVDNSTGLLDPYFALAEQYTFGDRMFQTNQGPSFPAHQFIISGTSAPSADSDLFVSENPAGVTNATNNTGCTAPSDEYVKVIDPSGSEAQNIYPCFEHQTLADLLDNAGVSWRYYAPSAGSIWTGPNAIDHLRFGPDWTNDVVLKPAQVLTDIANGQLANVSWVIPTGQESDHPGGGEGLGPSWVASIVNAIGQSQYWDNTAIIITWDDWGGWYDHVAPRVINSYEYGFRVPLIVVGPFAKQHYVSHVTHDFGSILKFIEEVYHLPSLGYADRYADDLSDCFDFHRHNRFQKIATPYDGKYFINDKTPPTDPDDD
ncbi:MAG: alkaline phosphatase family protein [Terriglobales bacterium]